MKMMLVSKDNNAGDDVQSIIEGGGGVYIYIGHTYSYMWLYGYIGLGVAGWVDDDVDIESIIEE